MNNTDIKKNKYTNICDNTYIKSLNDCKIKDKILTFNKDTEFHCRLIRQLYDGCLEFNKKKQKNK
jgi:hypothetical protein